MDFSLLSPLEFFVVPKNGDGRNNKPPDIDIDMMPGGCLFVYKI